MEEIEFHALISLQEMCLTEDCMLIVDRQHVLHGTRFHVEEGSFLQVYVGDDDTEESALDVQRSIQDEQAGVRHVLEQGRFQEGHRDADGSTGGDVPFHRMAPSHDHLYMVGMWRKPTLFFGLWLLSGETYAFCCKVLRIGEAMHPGPDIWIGTTNPRGLRGKEEFYYELPTGVWGISENHLTHLNQRDDLTRQWNEIPSSMALRLLPSRDPYEALYKEALSAATARRIGVSKLSSMVTLDIFTNGSCLDPSTPWAAAWAAVSATHDKVIVRGTVEGMQQTSDRAELVAIHEAVRYAVLNQGITTLWSGNAYVAGGVRLLRNINDIPRNMHFDAWEQMQRLLHGQEGRVFVQHASSHRHSERLAMDVDSWTACWNSRADHEALAAHSLRTPERETLRTRMLEHYHKQTALMNRLADFHFMIAEVFHAKVSENTNEYDIEQDSGEGDGLDGQRLCLHNVPCQRDLPLLPGPDIGIVQMVEKLGMCSQRA